MYVLSTTITALLVASGVSNVAAKSFAEAHSPFHLRHASFDELVHRKAHQVVEGKLNRRELATTSSSTAAATSSSAIIDTTEWNTTTTAACESALSVITRAVNPSGIVACYNIPYFDNTTGAFEADLRMYQVNAATGNFTGVSSDQISLSLTYPDASVSSSGSTKLKRNGVTARSPSSTSTVSTNSSTMTSLQDFHFVGQVAQTSIMTQITP